MWRRAANRGTQPIDLHPCSPHSIVAAALQSLGAEGQRVAVELDDDLPEVLVDAALLERSLANVVGNALRYSHDEETVRVTASVVEDRLHLRVVDRGPGIPVSERTKVIAPFQRLGDTNTSDGVGLGLSITRGFVEAMNGSLQLEDTPGGGLTAALVLRLADRIDDEPEGEVSA